MHNILLSLDTSLFKPSLTLINSIIQNNTNIKFHILIDNNKDEYQNLLEKHFKIDFEIKEFNNEEEINFLMENIVSFQKNQHIFNLMNFARFYLPTYFPEIKNGIYIDIDMIVQQNLDKILEEFNYFDKDFEILSPMIMDMESIGLNKIGYEGKAFNAGFMVWNLEKFRKENKIEEIEELMIKQKQEKIWKLGTQPILNIIYYQKVKDLNKNWNRKGFGKIGEDERMNKIGKNAFIIHWTGEVKPWDNKNVLGYQFWEKYIL